MRLSVVRLPVVWQSMQTCLRIENPESMREVFMKTFFTSLATIMVAGSSFLHLAHAQVVESKVNETQTASDTPLIDRELFFGNPQIAGGQLSPDGKFITFLKPYQGIMNVWVKEFAEPFEDARPLTDSKRPLYGYSWTEDGKYILFVKDSGGDENMNLFAVDPNAKPEEGQDTPPSRKP